MAELLQSTASVRFIKALRGVGMLQVQPREDERALSPTDLRRLVRDGEIHHLLVIEAGFATSLTVLRAPNLMGKKR